MEIAAMVYCGVRYPVSHEVAEYVIRKIEGFGAIPWGDFIEVPTTDGRQLLLRVSQSFPIAFESASNGE